MYTIYKYILVIVNDLDISTVTSFVCKKYILEILPFTTMLKYPC